MAKGRQINVQFPLGGENRRGGYAQNTQPFTTPRAINVQSVGPLEKRGRGGSRPGLTKFVNYDFGNQDFSMAPVSYADLDGAYRHALVVIEDADLDGVFDVHVVTAGSRAAVGTFLTDDSGNLVISDDDDYIILQTGLTLVTSFDLGMAQKGGKLYVNDGSSLLELDLRTGSSRAISGHPTGTAGQSLPMCVYGERLVMLGRDHMWYMSAADDVDDWNYSDEMTKASRAVAGGLGGGEIGDPTTTCGSYENHDKRALVMGTQDSLWVMYGNPADGGRLACASRNFGPISRRAIAVTSDGLVVFLARNGIYTWKIGSGEDPKPFSKHRVPEELMDVAITASTGVLMEYDRRMDCVHLAEVSSAPKASCFGWRLDMEHRALWRVSWPGTIRPHAVATLRTTGDSDVVWACADGYLRRFSTDAVNDDGTAITSDLLLGPFQLARDHGYMGALQTISGTLATGSGNVTWKAFVRDSAEEAVDDAVAAQGGDATVEVDASGLWQEGLNSIAGIRSTGAGAVIWLSATQPWAYESSAIVASQRGRYP